ncbi:MAG: type II toxin-antitoxin system Phd/YefM family antitoxin [Myxococcales bacterium]|nr:type II toxin-antitoxin system Phd/YefM family antitoxin [Myxococcales bacterium]
MGTKPQRSARRLSKHAVAEPMEPNAPAPKAGERILSTAEARSHLSETLGRVAYAGERVLIGKRGRPMAALVPVADLEALRAMEDAIDLQAARQSVREGGENLSHAAVGKRLGLR